MGPWEAKGAHPVNKPRHAGVKKVLLEPKGYEAVDLLKSKNKEYKYYLFTAKRPLEFSLEGPTQLSIKVRLIYGVTMKGRQGASILVRHKSALGLSSDLEPWTFTAEKSAVAAFAEHPKLAPSRAYNFKLDVPEGRHHYRLSLKADPAAWLAIRILIPKRDILPKNPAGH